jgi:tetratricopeptide (TPR) repeat protein
MSGKLDTLPAVPPGVRLKEVAVKTGLCLALLLVLSPFVAAADKLDDTYQSLMTAVASKDGVQVKQLVADLYPLTCEVAESPAPQDPDEKAAWASRVAYVKSIQLYSEYALFAVAIQSPPAMTVDLVSTLESQNPKSKYLSEAYGPYFVALTRTGASGRVLPIAEKAVANFPENVDLLLLLADNAMTKNQPDRAAGFADRLIASLNKNAKPESLPAADWERKRSSALGHGYWIAGVVHGQKNQYSAADKDLRAALPYIKGSEPMLATAYFYLGMANYQLGLMTLNKALVADGAKFSEQSALIAGPYAEQARHNALVMKAEAARMR